MGQSESDPSAEADSNCPVDPVPLQPSEGEVADRENAQSQGRAPSPPPNYRTVAELTPFLNW